MSQTPDLRSMLDMMLSGGRTISQAEQERPGVTSGAGGLGDLLGSMLGPQAGVQAGGGQSGGQGGGLGDLLGGMLSGGGSGTGAGGLGGLLSGGQGGRSGGGLGDMLGGMLGGGGAPGGGQGGLASGGLGGLLSGPLGGAIGAGVLAALMRGKVGKRIGKSGLALGGLAALGVLAYKAYQKNQPAAAAAATPQAPPVHELPPQDQADRAGLLIRGMIAAAKADGHVDGEEAGKIEQQLAPLGDGAQQFLMEEVRKPLDPEGLAAEARDPQAAAELYAVSVYMCGDVDPTERRYLDRLAGALGLDRQVAAEIERGLNEAG